MRIPPWNPDDAPRDPAVVEAVMKRRGGQLMALDRALLWSEPLARGWNAYLGEVRQNLAFDPRLKEIAICTVAKVTGADYEFSHHWPHYLKAGGTAALGPAMDDVDAALASPLLTDDERLCMRYAIAMTRSVKVPDDLFAKVRDRFGITGVVELTAAIAAYNMVARFLVALQVGD